MCVPFPPQLLGLLEACDFTALHPVEVALGLPSVQPRAVTVLLEAVEDADPRVRASATAALVASLAGDGPAALLGSSSKFLQIEVFLCGVASSMSVCMAGFIYSILLFGSSKSLTYAFFLQCNFARFFFPF